MRLRAARPTDAGRVGAILSAFTDDTPWMPRIHSRAEDLGHAGLMIDRGWVTVAEDGAVQGFVAREGDLIHALYVDAGARGQGVGARLLARMQSEAGALRLWTFAANDRAQAFYARHGFAEAARGDGSGNDEGLPDILMTWERPDP